MKFLIDECLSPLLANLAWDAGYVESAHICRRGMDSWRDNNIMTRILESDWTLVTNNANDFRPKPGSTSLKPCYVGVSLHAGLVCLNTPFGSTLDEQIYYFKSTLIYLSDKRDLINMILEVNADSESPDEIKFKMYDFPAE